MRYLAAVTVWALCIGVTAAHAERLGAVKRDLMVYPLGETDLVVGWVIVNTTPRGEVMAEVHIDDGEPRRVFDVVLTGVREPPYDIPRSRFEDALRTNGQGNGNCHVRTVLRDPAIEDLRMRVRVAIDDQRYYVTRKIEGVPLKHMRPRLTWLGPRWRGVARGVYPEAGRALDTRFRFKVRATNSGDERPSFVRVVLTRNGAPYRTLPLAPLRPRRVPCEGIDYGTSVRLPAGAYTYRFEAANRYGSGYGPPCAETGGLRVRRGQALALTGLAAAPTAMGAQFTFALSGPCQVQARALNMAGVPVKTVCRARECPAGMNVIVWDGTGDNGTALPGGMYLLDIVAKSPDGATAHALTPTWLVR